MSTTEPTVTCAATGQTRKAKLTQRGNVRLPRGWKRLATATYSPAGWKSLFVTRGLKVPVAWPENKEDQQALADAVRAAQEQCRRLANATMTLMYAHDLKTATWDAEGKLAAYQSLYLYPTLRAMFPDADSNMVCAVEHRVGGLYLKDRWHVLTGRRSLRTLRSSPAIIKNTKSQRLYLDHEGNLRAVLTIGRGARFLLELCRTARNVGDGRGVRSRRNFNRNYESLTQVVRDGLPTGEMHVALDNRGQIMLTVICALPKRAPGQRTGTLHVRSDAQSLLVALNDKDERLWDYHADQLIRRQAAHKRRLARWADDTKFEDRPHPALAERRSTAVVNHRAWLNTLVEQVSARVVGYADRRRLATIALDFTHERLTDAFEWSRLTTRITQKADALGIGVTVKGKTDDTE